MNKKAQGLPMNVVILGIIVIVVLIVVLVFFVGGTATIMQKIKQVFGLQASGQQLELTVQACIDSCTQNENRDPAIQKNSLYCKGEFVVDHDANADTLPRMMGCRESPDTPSEEDQKRRGLDSTTSSLNVPCPGIVSCV